MHCCRVVSKGQLSHAVSGGHLTTRLLTQLPHAMAQDGSQFSRRRTRKKVGRKSESQTLQEVMKRLNVEKNENQDLRELHPEGRVITKGYHRVSRLHRIYYEVHGNQNGYPAVVLHGGPGAGCSDALG